jgi:hypothetical protein
MTYYQRPRQLLKTLESFTHYKNDFSVVIVDDNSPDDIKLPPLPFDVTIIKLRKKQWINTCVTYNIGFHEALKSRPELIMIQNAECYHNGDVIGYAIKHTTDRNYVSFAAYSLASGEDVNLKILNPRGAVSNGDSAWYNHSLYRAEALHFCCAITAKNLKRINGFDERIALGLGYEDNLLIHQIRTLGLKVQIIDDPFVFHQYHYDVKSFDFNLDLFNRTGAYCSELIALKQYRAEHLITPDL